MEKTTLYFKGLDCPNCTEKIADRIKKLSSVKNSELNFMTKKLTYEEVSKSAISDIKNIVKEIEPDVKVVEAAGSDSGEETTLFDFIRLIAALLIFAVSFIPKISLSVSIILIVLAYAVSGYDVVINCIRNIIKLRPFDECFLMTVATAGAFALGDYREAAAVMIFYQIGEFFQSYAVKRSRKSITSLLELRPDKVSVKRDGEIISLAPEQVKISDVVVLKAGERAPLDCKLLGTDADFDMSALTGESVPVSVGENSEVLSGSISLSKTVELEVIRPFSESAMSKILDMVENASAKKAKTERFITKFAKIYTPVVVICALMLVFIPYLASGFSFDAFKNWGYRALLFLVVSCPCALVVSVPLGFFAGIGGASRKGILIKGANNIEIMSNVRRIAFDKTGTLTSGKFKVSSIADINADEKDVLKYCAYAELNSNHPIAKSIVDEYIGRGGTLDESLVSHVTEISGRGVKAMFGGKTLLAGNRRLLSENGIDTDDKESANTCVYVGYDGKFIGRVALEDDIKQNARSMISRLNDMGVETVMLTGDRELAASSVAKRLGVAKYRSELLPEGKVEYIEQMLKTKEVTAFAGDGINDAPVLARADIGISMGALGSDIAIETADAVIMNDDVGKITTLINVCKKTMRIVKANIVFAIFIKILVLMLGALGYANMWAAVFADVGVALMCVLNSLRALSIRE